MSLNSKFDVSALATFGLCARHSQHSHEVQQSMSVQSLEDLLQSVDNTAAMLRNSKVGAYVYPVVPSGNWIGK